jgi:hypothetical protein
MWPGTRQVKGYGLTGLIFLATNTLIFLATNTEAHTSRQAGRQALLQKSCIHILTGPRRRVGRIAGITWLDTRQRRVSVTHQSSRRSPPLLILSKHAYLTGYLRPKIRGDTLRTLQPQTQQPFGNHQVSKSLSDRLSPTFVGFLGLVHPI